MKGSESAASFTSLASWTGVPMLSRNTSDRRSSLKRALRLRCGDSAAWRMRNSRVSTISVLQH
ncbi:MAG: hypothetical protein HZB91_05810 [Elusimicrobia bacterium]|nr:hypothetical protein [Elusimicrobiota bacterium]